jgi:hypothetical protein
MTSMDRTRNWRSFFDWGITAVEKEYAFPCDLEPNLPETLYYRGMTVHAGAERIFPWLCQMRVAPYSYDWLDNLGRKSPRVLSPGITDLSVGQVFMTGFELVSFEPNRHVTLRSRDLPAWLFVFGDIVITYMIVPANENRSRLLVKMRVAYPTGLVMGALMRFLLPPGDTFMMHKQLRTFKALAETS